MQRCVHEKSGATGSERCGRFWRECPIAHRLPATNDRETPCGGKLRRAWPKGLNRPLQENERMRSGEHVPKQNRVTPFGDIVAVTARGALMGNRGCLHDGAGRIVRRTRLPAWIYCLLEFKGRKRTVMSPGRYTELFFLDEATALAAGHRPCAECQRGRYKEFMQYWGTANAALSGGERLLAGRVDAVLQAERLGPDGGKVTFRARLDSEPSGAVTRGSSRVPSIT